jgi:hypothetical protein
MDETVGVRDKYVEKTKTQKGIYLKHPAQSLCIRNKHHDKTVKL